jgi:predicted nucleic acid-binding protein
MIRAVIDTSVLVPRRSREALQIAAQDSLYTALWSPWIIAELHRVLTWRWLKATNNDTSLDNQRRCSRAAKAMMQILVPTFELIDTRPPYPSAWDGFNDEDDMPIWATAIAGKATHVVSNNTRHYPPLQADGRHVYLGIEFISARDFLNLLYNNQAD